MAYIFDISGEVWPMDQVWVRGSYIGWLAAWGTRIVAGETSIEEVTTSPYDDTCR